MSLTLVSAAPAYPVTLAEAKAHLRLDTSDDDALVDALIAAATAHLDGRDGWLGRALVQQTWDLKLHRFPGVIDVPLPPLQSVTSITYLDSNNVSQTLATSKYQVDGNGQWRARIKPAYGETWPSTYDAWNAVTVRFVAGYEPGSGSPTDYAENVPQPIKHALLLLISHWYENRAPVNIGNIVSALPMTVDALLAPYRVMSFA
ncbi:MAG TPA: head-tail connector protein [Azospirillum sp.]|nr:head-tail connector protein [Azospirillum sp.]